VRLGLFISAVVVSAPDLVHAALVEKEDAFVKGVGLSLFGRPLLGAGLLTSENGFHRRQRRMMAPAFMPRRIAEYAAVIASYADRSIERLRARETVDLGREMMLLTLEIAGKTLFGADVSGDAKDVGEGLSPSPWRTSMPSSARSFRCPRAVLRPRTCMRSEPSGAWTTSSTA
jgi:cytochrome P450